MKNSSEIELRTHSEYLCYKLLLIDNNYLHLWTEYLFFSSRLYTFDQRFKSWNPNEYFDDAVSISNSGLLIAQNKNGYLYQYQIKGKINDDSDEPQIVKTNEHLLPEN